MAPDRDQEVVATVRRDGIGILRQVLSPQEVETVRQEFDRAHLDLDKGPGTPGVRDSLSGEALLAYPNLAALYSHPRIMAIVAALLNEPVPWVWVVKTNRYTPEHGGVSRHTDGFLGELAPPFTRQAMAVFLDDVDEESGALTYVPGTHLLHYNDDPRRRPPTQADIDAGQYVPATPKAGDVVFRVPEVWHAVIPIYRLRRYVTASYTVRGRLSEKMQQRTAAEVERRKETPLEAVPQNLQPYWIADRP